MVRIAVKGVLARKLRTLLTSIAIMLGVGFVAGAFILTDTMRGSFKTLFDEATKNSDVQVITRLADRQLKALQKNPQATLDLSKIGIDASIVDQIGQVPGVKRAEGSVFEVGMQPLDKDGAPLGGQGAPTFGAGWPGLHSTSGPLHIVHGSAPRVGEAMLDEFTAKAGHYRVGDRLRVLIPGGAARSFRLSGIIKFGESASLNGASITVVEMRTAQRLLGLGNRFSAIDVNSDDGVGDATLRRRIQQSLGSDYVAKTAAQVSTEQQQSIDNGFLDILQNVILAFAAVSVFVGAFTIFNTFTITVGQRTQEFGLLRAVGASRTQVLGIVLLEALVTGLVASTIGIGIGYGVAAALKKLLATFGATLPGSGFSLQPRTIVASYLVGMLVTVIASAVPAMRASRLSPLEAMRAGTSDRSERAWVPIAGVALVVLGGLGIADALLMSDWRSTSHVLTWLASGSALVLVGVSLAARWMIGPMVSAIGRVLTFGVSGSLARRNILRSRARASATSAALMIGLSLSCLALVFHASLGATIDKQITDSIGADVSVYSKVRENTGQGVVSDATLDRIRAVDGVAAAEGQRQGIVARGKKYDIVRHSVPLAGFEPGALTSTRMVKFTTSAGSVADLADGSVLVSRKEVQRRNLKLGGSARFTFPSGQTHVFRVAAIFKQSPFDTNYVVTVHDFDAYMPRQLHGSAFVYIKVDRGQRPSVVAQRITRAVGTEAEFLVIKDSEGLRQQFRKQLAPVLGMVLAMLALSLVIALFGIANTLALNVFERTREIGLLRAVGATRRQVRRMVRGEAILVALFGSILGTVAGIAFAAAIIFSLKDEGFIFHLSWWLVAVLAVGFLAGVIASILPARRAARMDVLRAITHD